MGDGSKRAVRHEMKNLKERKNERLKGTLREQERQDGGRETKGHW